jgi:hypothetical protein
VQQPPGNRRVRSSSTTREGQYGFTATRLDGERDGDALVLLTIRRMQRAS